MAKLNDFRLQLGKNEYVPLMIGGMGVDISTSSMALEGARLGGIGHMSDALICSIADKYCDTHLEREGGQGLPQFHPENIERAIRTFVEKTMSQKRGSGGVFINLMEKLTMNNPRETLEARLNGALNGGIDGISLGAGLHLSSMDLIKDNPRFREVKVGIIVSSARALRLFLKRSARVKRHPDFIVVEGPLAGGHLGFGIDDWASYDLKTIMLEVIRFLDKEDLAIPVIPAGGIFTGTDGVDFMESGASAIQVATRFTIAKESGLPDKAKQEYFKAREEDIEVNLISPTGYPMRMLKNSPCIGTGGKPNCERHGYILDKNGNCGYIDAYNTVAATSTQKISVRDKTCLCTQMKAYRTWTCGHTTYRLKDTTNRLPDGTYQQPTVEQIFNDYQYSQDHQISLPELRNAS